MTSPRWSRRLLTWLAPKWRRDDVIGDLEEMHGRYVRRHGAAAAWLRSSFDAAIVAAGFARDRIAAVNGWATWPDVRLGLRQMRQSPVLSVTAILALATGIGLATIGFALLDALIYSTLPFANGDRFVRIEIADDSGAAIDTAARYDDIAARAPALDHVGAATGGEFNLALPSGEIAPIRTVLITPASLRHLPGRPLAGRPLIDADGAPGAAPVALLSEGLWRRRFDGDVRAVGRSIDVAGVRRSIVGVMPADFEFPTRPEMWLPLEHPLPAGATAVRLFGVLREGASIESANAQLRAIAVAAAAPGQDPGAIRIAAMPYTLESGPGKLFFGGLVVILVLILLVVAANLATLVAARGWARSMELAVRTALGAGRVRIVGQLFVEVLVLGAIAAVIGAAGAHAFLRWMEVTIIDIPFWIHFAASPRTVLFVVLVTLTATVVAGVLPALAVTRGNLAAALQAGGRSVASGFGLTAQALIIVQVSLSVALLGGAAAMARGLVAHISGTPAIDESRILTARITAGPLADAGDDIAAQSRIVDAVRTVPGVIAAGAATHVPRQDAPAVTVDVEVPGEPVRQATVPGVAVGQGFFDALGASVSRGRLFSDADGRAGAAPVALVNDSFVASVLGGRSPLGLRIRAAEPRRADAPAWREIVGVVPDLGMSVADRSAGAGYYVPLTGGRSFRIAIRTAGDPRRIVPSLRTVLADLDATLQVRNVMPLAEVGWEERAFLTGVATAMIALGGVALLLSVVSVYALLSFAVTRRTREIGIRLALGASRGSVVSSVLRAAALCLSIGIVLGLGLGAVLMEAREFIVFRIPTGGAWSVPAVVLPLLVAGLVACWVPARRALGIQPAEALRQ